MGDIYDTEKGGLLVIERQLWPSETVASGNELASLDASYIPINYKGVEGRPWPAEEEALKFLDDEEGLLYDGLASLEEFAAVRDYFMDMSSLYRVNFLYCCIKFTWHNSMEAYLPLEFRFRGYDYGYYEGAYNKFSAICNDVAGGPYASLRAFESLLNSHYLLPSISMVHQLDIVRRQLISEGAFLEHDEEFRAIAIYEYVMS